MKYDRQLIIKLQSGTKKQRREVDKGACDLEFKNVFETDKVSYDYSNRDIFDLLISTSKVKDAVAKLTEKSRLYLLGHGNYKSVGGMTGVECADFLHNSGLTRVKRISVVSCHAGGGFFLPDTVDTFAKTLSWALGKKYNLFVEVVARAAFVGIDEMGRKWIRQAWSLAHKPKGSKILIQWSGNSQFITGVYGSD